MSFNEIYHGMVSPQKMIHPKFLYDRRGSEIFQEICLTYDYYPTRCEKEILEFHSQEMADLIGPGAVIIEPGSGASEKVRYLLEKLERPAGYIPIEISEEILNRAAFEIRTLFPHMEVPAICADFTETFDCSHALQGEKEVIFFPGSTIGNLDPSDAVKFLRRLSSMIKPNGGFLIGVDTKKSSEVFLRAYDDGEGVTAKFNLNLLERLNREYKGDFDVSNFTHEVLYDEKKGRVEMHLKSLSPQYVRLNDCVFSFMAGETIHTESSYKYSPEEFAGIASEAGLNLVKSWTDSEEMFRVYYFEKK